MKYGNSLEKDLKFVVVYHSSPKVKETKDYKIVIETRLQITISMEEESFRYQDVYAEQDYREHPKTNKVGQDNIISDKIGTPKLYSVLYINHKEGTVKYHTKSPNSLARTLSNRLDGNIVLRVTKPNYSKHTRHCWSNFHRQMLPAGVRRSLRSIF